MIQINLTIIITFIVFTFTLFSCHQTNESDGKDTTLLEKENEVLKMENELLKKKQELYRNSTKKISNKSTVNTPSDNSVSNTLDFLKKFDGKYPHEVKLLDNALFTQRLRKLLGNSRYNFLKETWAVETPMEFANNIFVASACQAHFCASTNFIIAVDFTKNVMYAGIREDDHVKTYSEDGSRSLEVSDWANGN